MQSATASIQAASYNQAMDWSLVLTSQGIVNTVEALDTGEWVVSIPQESATLAAASIHAYEQENTIPWRDLVCVFLCGGIVVAAWSAAFQAAAQ